MRPDETETRRLSFGEFMLDCRSRELRRNGRRIKLQPQPARLLVLLASRAGELVTREEIEAALWGKETFVDFEHGINFAIRQIRDALGDTAEKPRYVETVPRVGYRFLASIEDVPTDRREPDRSPYPGLLSFSLEDSPFFFGREEEVDSLWSKLGRGKLLALIGPSGAGKTSLLQAGLVPARPTGWDVMLFRPRENPLSSLACALSVSGAAGIGSSKIVEQIRRWREAHVEALLCVDAFEESFTRSDEEIRSRFCEILGRAAKECGVRVLLSMRDDFLIHCHDHPELAPVFSDLTPLKPPRGPALIRVVTEPARKLGYQFEDESLVDEIITEVRKNEGEALPRLAFALSRLWEKRDRERKILTRRAYLEIGGVREAVAQQAEGVLETIGTERGPIVREIFRTLTTARGSPGARDREELLSLFEDRRAAADVLGKLIEAKLLTETVPPRIEIANEALLSTWPRLSRWQAGGADDAHTSVVETAPSRARRSWVWAAAGLACGALLVGLLGRPAADLEPVGEMSLMPPPGTRFTGGNIGRRAFALSPDGQRLAFVSRDTAGEDRLGVRELSSFETRMLEGTETAIYPFWSPDGKHIGFFQEGKLMRIPVGGGPPQTVCDAYAPRGGTWNGDGVILFAPPFGPIQRVAAARGIPEPVTDLDPSRSDIAHRWPHFLPDDDHFLFFVRSSEGEQRGIYLGSLRSRETRFLAGATSNALYTEPGYLLFVRDQTLVAQPFSAESLELMGEPEPLATNVELTRFSQAALAVENGVMVYSSGGELQQLTWFDRDGRTLDTIGPPANHHSFSLSPDDNWLAVSRHDPDVGGFSIWIFERDGSVPLRRTTQLPSPVNPRWSGDGTRLFFDTASIPSSLYRLQPLGSSPPEPVLDLSSGSLRDVSRVGPHVIVTEENRLRVLDASNGRPVAEVSASNLWDRDPSGTISPDGRWLAFDSNETGRPEVYVTSFPEPGRRYPVSQSGGLVPRWRADGKELFFIAPDGSLMASPVNDGGGFRAGAPRRLFDLGGDDIGYDVADNGERFLVNVPLEEAAELNVVFDWTKRRSR